jgi:hypothetical protein
MWFYGLSIFAVQDVYTFPACDFHESSGFALSYQLASGKGDLDGEPSTSLL